MRSDCRSPTMWGPRQTPSLAILLSPTCGVWWPGAHGQGHPAMLSWHLAHPPWIEPGPRPLRDLPSVFPLDSGYLALTLGQGAAGTQQLGLQGSGLRTMTSGHTAPSLAPAAHTCPHLVDVTHHGGDELGHVDIAIQLLQVALSQGPELHAVCALQTQHGKEWLCGDTRPQGCSQGEACRVLCPMFTPSL